jgi:hypothetical protein
MPYDPRRSYDQRYVPGLPVCALQLLNKVENDARTLCRALGYDLNTVEFAVENGVPYAIDFMNPAPDADLHSIGSENFNWIVDAVAGLAVKKANSTVRLPSQMNSTGLLAGTSKAQAKPKQIAKPSANKPSSKKRPSN